MSVSPRNLLDVAHVLGSVDNETHHRGAISKAYYAGYHECGDWLKSLPGVASLGGGPDGGVHIQLINRLKSPAHEVQCNDTRKLSKILGARLEVFKMHRVKADYFLAEPHPYKDWASNILAGIEQMFDRIAPVNVGNPTPAAATPGVEQGPPLAPASAAAGSDSGCDSVLTTDTAVVSGVRPALKRVK